MRASVSTASAPTPMGPYSQAIIHGDFIFVSGQGAVDPSTGQYTPSDVGTETEHTLRNIAAILQAAGSSMDQVVKCSVYLRDMADFARMNEVYARYFNAPPPARTTIQAVALPGGIKVEIDVIAAR